ncbi:VOC family protein [Candidatus Cloacimonadota bacterium]
MPPKISHVGIAVKSVEETAKPYEKLGLKIESIEVAESQKVGVAFIPVGDLRIGLLEPTSEKITVAKFIGKRREGAQNSS